MNLALLTGNYGKPSAGLYPLFTGANLLGSLDVGCAPTGDPDAPGLGVRELADAIRAGRIRALQVIGDSPSFTNGDLPDFLGALKELDFLLAQDTFPSEITELADVVLPSATFAEKSGTYTNLERRTQLLRPAVGPKAEEEPDWQIICRLAERMGAEGFDYADGAAVFDEIASALPDYAGLSHRRLNAGGIQTPCPDADSRGTPIVGASDDSRASLSPLTLPEPAPRQDADYPFLLARGRLLHQPERESGVRMVESRYAVEREVEIELHQDDAERLGISEGEWIEVAHAGGALSGVARLGGPLRGVVNTTSLFGELILELEASESPDPMLKTPGLPLLPARVGRPAAEAAD